MCDNDYTYDFPLALIFEGILKGAKQDGRSKRANPLFSQCENRGFCSYVPLRSKLRAGSNVICRALCGRGALRRRGLQAAGRRR